MSFASATESGPAFEDYDPSWLADSTEGTDDLGESFSLPYEPNPTAQAKSLLPQIKDPEIAKNVESFLSTISTVVKIHPEFVRDVRRLPQIHASIVNDDDSVLIEWVFPSFRLGCNVESSPEESGWHIVSQTGTASGPLTSSTKTALDFLKFILSQT